MRDMYATLVDGNGNPITVTGGVLSVSTSSTNFPGYDPTYGRLNVMMGPRTLSRYSAISAGASATVKSGAGDFIGLFFSGLTLLPTITLYDNTSASGNILTQATNIVLTAPFWFPPVPIPYANGVTYSVSGTGNLTFAVLTT